MMYLENRRSKCCVIAGVLIAGTTPAFGQWIEQIFALDAGWNAVYLEVDPTSSLADEVRKRLEE